MAAQKQFPAPERFVMFSSAIDPDSARSLVQTMAALANEGIQSAALCLATPGGGIAAGMHVYNVLRALPFHLVTHNVGNVASMGIALFAAGDERHVCPHATFTFHAGEITPLPGKTFDAALLEQRRDELIADDTRERLILEDRTKLSREEIETLVGGNLTIDADAAVKAGVADAVSAFAFTPEVPVIAL
jgi:ATP-dependent Clp protease protease subunit